MLTVLIGVAAFAAGAVFQAAGLFGWIVRLVSRRASRVE